MCGICGRFNFGTGQRVTNAELKRMNDLMVHRGPDDEGTFSDGNAGIAMRRLAIIDLSTGHQPISNETGDIRVVLNGEIYNFQALRAELEKKGHEFQTKTDTEVLVHLYEEEGPECVKRLRGMFAFAIWDRPRQRMMLARDRVGKKPLLYTVQPGWMAFASEMRCLLELGIPKDIEYQAIDLFLSLQYIPSPFTIFKSVKKLEPGHFILIENGNIKTERYWDLPLDAKPATTDPEEAKVLIREKLTEAVKLRMISDVPLGAFLSGGIDSSIIVALMSKLSDKPVKTFTVGFAEAEFSEVEYARQVADMYGCEHREIILKAEMSDILPKLAWHYGEPYADSSALPSYYVAKETKKHVTVALNGDGGDENFAGYHRYVAMKIAHYWDYLPASLRSGISFAAEFLPEKTAPVDIFWRAKRFLRSGVFSELAVRHLKMACFFNEDEKDCLFTDAIKKELGDHQHGAVAYLRQFFSRSEGQSFINRVLYTDFKSYLPECLMVKIDIATMANSLEGRSPLLDNELTDLVYPMQDSWKLKGITGTKWILRETFKSLLPPKIYKRGKQGFGIPLGPWFRGDLRRYWEERCLSQKALARGYFKKEALMRLWHEHQSGKRDHGFRLWALLMLELWHETYAPDAGIGKS